MKIKIIIEILIYYFFVLMQFVVDNPGLTMSKMHTLRKDRWVTNVLNAFLKEQKVSLESIHGKFDSVIGPVKNVVVVELHWLTGIGS